jgi:hypothetical protein
MLASLVLSMSLSNAAEARTQNSTDPVLIGKLTSRDAVGSGVGFARFPVSLSGNTAIVGAAGIGAAYIFERDPTSPNGWRQAAALTPDPAVPQERFRRAAISGDTAVVTLVTESNRVDLPIGYVFQRNHGGANAWGRVAALYHTDPSPIQPLPNSVAISGGTILVGTIALPNGVPSAALPGGVAYLFGRDKDGPNMWGQVARLTRSHDEDDATTLHDDFGESVAISGTTAIVGATGVSDARGAAYIFARDQGGADQWGQVAKLTPNKEVIGNFWQFGQSVGISGNTAIVGAAPRGEGEDRNIAYLFERDASGTWRERAHQIFLDGGGRNGVAIDGNVAAVGSTNGEGRRPHSGIVHVLERNQGGANAWGETLTLGASDGEAFSVFGESVSISGSMLLVGDPNGDLRQSNTGAAYVCDLNALGATHAACIRSPHMVTVNQMVSLSVIKTTCCAPVSSQVLGIHFPASFVITATLTNTSATSIHDPHFQVIELTDDNSWLLNGDNVGRPPFVFLTPDVGDGLLEPGESTTVTFIIGLSTRNPFRFLVNVRGERR